MTDALTFPKDTTEKTVTLGGPNTGTATHEAAAPKGGGISAYSSTEGQPAKKYRDNVTGAIYSDESKCVNGCTVVVGSDPVKAPGSSLPAKQADVDAAQKKATPQAANKAIKRTTTKTKK